MPDAGTCWSQLYRQAILESDRGMLGARIDEASEAIRCRSRELWYAGSPDTRERHDLDAALRFLGLLQMVSLEKTSN